MQLIICRILTFDFLCLNLYKETLLEPFSFIQQQACNTFGCKLLDPNASVALLSSGNSDSVSYLHFCEIKQLLDLYIRVLHVWFFFYAPN